MDVTIVGAGVVGLTTAVALERAGHRVQVVAAATGDATTSAAAGAIWFPYRCGPLDRVAAWATATRAWLLDLAARDPAAGVDVLTSYEITASDARPWWADLAIDLERVAAPVVGAPLAWRFAAPRVEPTRFLAWLTSQLARPIDRRVVTDLAAEPGDAVINCTGLGARALCADHELTPLFGQLVVTPLGAIDPAISITDDRDPDALFYLIPRRDALVLGGCSLPWPSDAAPVADPAIAARILAHAARLGLAIGAPLSTRVGLRPFRPTVRLERDPLTPRLIHCYGHGGAGFTLAHGCAAELVALLAQPRPISRAAIDALVASELARDDVPDARARLTPFLCTPTPLRLTWQYGREDDVFDAWLVGTSPDGTRGLVYCTEGLGSSFPWGIVQLKDRDMGMDDVWHAGLADAAICAGLIAAPPGYACPGPREE